MAGPTPTCRARRRYRRGGTARRIALAGVLAVVGLVVGAVVVDVSRPSRAPPDPPPGSGPSAPAGAQVEVVVQLGGRSLGVTETVTWPDQAPTTLALAWPEPDVLTGAVAGLAPAVRALEIRADDREPAAPDPASPQPWALPLPGGSSRLRLTYVLEGSVLLSDATVPGRALAVFSPLTGSAAGTGPVVVRLEGNGLLNVACPVAEGAAPDPCGHQSDGSWVVSLPDEGPGLVLVQLDLSGLT